MAQGSQNALRQRKPILESKKSLSCSDLDEKSFFKKEKFIDYTQWQNIAENRRLWYDYNHNSKDRKEAIAIQHLVIPCIRDIITTWLTTRQKQVFTMYFLHDHTQVHIARELGISQSTVSQHINGKKRNGKNIGGSIRKIRKAIRFMSLDVKGNHSKYHIIKTLSQLLDETTGLRKSHELIQSMLQ
jgi:RNA polymerase sigma factor (sigma-70 family)